MKTLFQNTLTRLGHLSDETLTRLVNGELSSVREFQANAHLGRCWQCKARREALESAAFQVVLYRNNRMEKRLPLSPARRDTFLVRLDEVLEETAAAPWWSRLFTQRSLPSIPVMNPVYASVFVIVIAAILLALIWQRNASPMSARLFLDGAVAAETTHASLPATGVIYQKIEIRTGSGRLERAIYRDVALKRKPRPLSLDRAAEAMRHQTESAGIDWQQPLSATSFRTWHDHQVAATDDVHRGDHDLLTLTTSMASGPIAEESFTVRAQDFHPVSRTVSMRNDESIEIAEVHYDVLGWDAVNDALFEPLGGGVVTPSVTAAVPHVTSPVLLDLAELQARLVLNRLHADSTEQLEFVRSQASIEIKGIVDTGQRKQELTAQLKTVPHIVPAIFSVDDLRAHSDEDHTVSSIHAYTAVVEASPMEQFLRAQGKGTETLNATSQHLLDAALSIKRESAAITDLDQRFGNKTQLDEAGRAALQQLLDAHASTLLQAIDLEDGILAATVTSRPAGLEAWSALDGTRASLGTAAGANLSLCKELITGTNGSSRSAVVIASEIFRSTQQMRNSFQSGASSKSPSAHAPLPPSEK